MKYRVPSPVIDILAKLESNGFEAFAVGGCVRDLLLERDPKDWDITTDATPDKILALFPDSFYENDFGTVGVKTVPFLPSGNPDRKHDIVEVTTYRTETGYSDNRRPDEVSFAATLEEDLARRDFTMNAMAAEIREQGAGSREQKTNPEEKPGKNECSLFLVPCSLNIVDPFGGSEDIGKKIIRAVGNADERFGEDALRMIRAVRFFAELRSTRIERQGARDEEETETDWKIEENTLEAIKKHAGSIAHVSWERIRDEFSRIILSNDPAKGVELLRETGLLRHILPELEEGIGVGQNLHHIYTVWEHNLRALRTCPSEKLEVRLAALLHDVAKPRTKRGNGYRSTFYNHDHVGARMTRTILTRLRYPKNVIEKAVLLVDNHLFYYNVGEVTESSVRRLVRRVGLENMADLMAVRIGDRLGSGVPKAKPYKLRHLEYMIDKVSKDPISVKMLAIHGNDLLDGLGIDPGPKVGAILDVLLSEVIEKPERNTREHLLARARELSSEEIGALREKAKEVIDGKREEDDKDTRRRHRVA
jgi:tRNA nucleotidyltransferase (CCA-adding enzyme)